MLPSLKVKFILLQILKKSSRMPVKQKLFRINCHSGWLLYESMVWQIKVHLEETYITGVIQKLRGPISALFLPPTYLPIMDFCVNLVLSRIIWGYNFHPLDFVFSIRIPWFEKWQIFSSRTNYSNAKVAWEKSSSTIFLQWFLPFLDHVFSYAS